ncbi:hypothetical protein GCM10009601_53400 [Streptomyces thermospinosisporus]|uniref:Secreted protein n=1 Tax=Streptomyces thermospinosisporus TaxID=161482 RepID=A0ABP4JVY2_9ACTN
MICSRDSPISFASVPFLMASFAFSVSMEALSITRIALTFSGRRTWGTPSGYARRTDPSTVPGEPHRRAAPVGRPGGLPWPRRSPALDPLPPILRQLARESPIR